MLRARLEEWKSGEIGTHQLCYAGATLESAHGQALATAQGSSRGRSSVNPRAARRVGRDVKAVHSDITALFNAGVLDRVEDGRIIFPSDAIKVEFSLEVA